jgi:hypothetical protein
VLTKVEMPAISTFDIERFHSAQSAIQAVAMMSAIRPAGDAARLHLMAEIALSDAARKRLAPVLDKFEPSEASSYQARVAVERERVPVPWLPYLALVQIIGCRDLGAAEKTMWQVPIPI